MRKYSVFMAAFALAICAWGQETGDGGEMAGEPDKNPAPTAAKSADLIRTSGYFILDMGLVAEMQAVPSIGAGATAGMKTFENEPFGDIIGGIRLSAQPMKRLEIMINPELKSQNIIPMEPGITRGEEIQKTRWNIYMEEAKADWTFGARERPFVKAGFGLMVYKENPDTRIFGDYLFRSMIYPALVFTTFNYPKAQIYGLHVENNLGEGFRHDLFVLSETKHYPFYDVSLAYTADYSFRNLVEVGAGVNFRSLIPVRPSRLTPAMGNSLDNEYIEIPLQNNTPILDSTGTLIKTVTIRQATNAGGAPIDSTWVVVVPAAGAADSVLVGGVGVNGLKTGLYSNPALSFAYLLNVQDQVFPALNPELTRFSFAGTLLTGRIAFNPLGFMPVNPLGRNAGKIYLEGALLGVKNYPGLYEKARERMPLMAGVNLPTLDYLDFLTAEVEYYPSRHIPTYKRRAKENIPQPGTYKGETAIENEWSTESRQKRDDWKWGLAAKKSFNAFSLVAQVGSDHTKLSDQEGEAYIDILTKPSHWYFQVRVIGGIY